MMECLDSDPAKRPTAQQLLQRLSSFLPRNRQHGMGLAEEGGSPVSDRE